MVKQKQIFYAPRLVICLFSVQSMPYNMLYCSALHALFRETSRYLLNSLNMQAFIEENILSLSIQIN